MIWADTEADQIGFTLIISDSDDRYTRSFG